MFENGGDSRQAKPAGKVSQHVAVCPRLDSLRSKRKRGRRVVNPPEPQMTFFFPHRFVASPKNRRRSSLIAWPEPCGCHAAVLDICTFYLSLQQLCHAAPTAHGQALGNPSQGQRRLCSQEAGQLHVLRFPFSCARSVQWTSSADLRRLVPEY